LLAELYSEFVENGGQVWLCGACTKPRAIDEESLAKGATIIGAAKVVEEVVAGAKTIAFA
jgi:predicted peroxiredoxin